MKLCKEDCEELESNVCKSDFRVARKFDYLSAILPNCTVLPLKGSKEGEGCVTLGLWESDTDSSKHLEASTEHQSSDNYYPTQPALTELVQSSQKPPSSKRSSFSPTETKEPLTNAAGLPVEPVMKADEPLNNGSFLQMSLGEINPSSSELSHTSSVVNEVGSDTVLNPSDQVEGNVSIKVCQSYHPLTSQTL